MRKEKPAKESRKIDSYTPTEVGTMLESIHKEIKTIGEGHSDLDRRLEKVEIEVHGLVDKFPIIEISHRVLNDKVSRFEMALSKFNKDLKGEIAEVRKEFKSELGEVRKEVVAVKTELKKEIRDLSESLTSVESRP